MRLFTRPFLPTLVFCSLAALPGLAPAHADSPERSAAKFASGNGNILYLAAGVGLPLLTDGADGRNHSLRALDAVGTTVLLTEGLKYLVREKRPDSNERDSFPSGHASAAFAVATAESAFHPKQAPYWFLGATLIAVSRVRLNRHYTQDVVAGAALGYGVTRLELSQPRGLILSPLIQPGSIGVQMTQSFR